MGVYKNCICRAETRSEYKEAVVQGQTFFQGHFTKKAFCKMSENQTKLVSNQSMVMVY